MPTSADGRLTATLDEDFAGVYLRADFGDIVEAENLMLDPIFAYGQGGFTANSGGTVTLDPALFHEGDQSLKVESDGTGYGARNHQFVTVPAGPVTLAGWINVDVASPGPAGLRLGGSGVPGTDSPTVSPGTGWQRVTVSTTATEDGLVTVFLGSNSASGASIAHFDMLTLTVGTDPEDFHGDTPDQNGFEYWWVGTPGNSASRKGLEAVDDVTAVRFIRGDGTPVRSGDPAVVVGGKALAYEAEAPIGEVTSWHAVPEIGGALLQAVEGPDGPTGLAMSIPRELEPKHNLYEAWPLAIKTSGGAWLLAHKAGTNHVGDQKDVVVNRSTDEGVSWTQTHIFTAPNTHHGGGQLVTAGDGSVILSTKRIPDAGPEEIVFWRSVDDGLTFAEVVAYEWDQVATLGQLVLLQNGDLLASYHGQGWGVVRSTDDGATWTITGTANGGPWLSEGRMIQADDGTIIAIGRAGNLNIYYSTDNGASWSVGTDSGITPDAGGNTNTEGFIRDAEGHIDLVWISRDTYKMYYTESTVEAVLASPTAWAPSITLTDLKAAKDADLGYPTLLHRTTGELWAAFYQDPDRTGTPSIYTTSITELESLSPDANRTDPVELFILGPDDPTFVWLTSISDPTKSVLAEVWGGAPNVTYAPKQQVAPLHGSPYPATSHDGWSASTQEWRFYAETPEDRDAIEDALMSGVVLVQTDGTTGLRDFYAIAGQIGEGPTDTNRNADSIVSVSSFTEQRRPGTEGSPLIIPGHSCGDFFAATQSVGNVTNVFPTAGDTDGLSEE